MDTLWRARFDDAVVDFKEVWEFAMSEGGNHDTPR